MKFRHLILMALIVSVSACKKDKGEAEPQLIFKVKLDPQQPRLDVMGNPSVMPAGHAAQNPEFNFVALHSIELVPNKFTQFEQGICLLCQKYHAKWSCQFRRTQQIENGDVVSQFSQQGYSGSYEYLFVWLIRIIISISVQTDMT